MHVVLILVIVCLPFCSLHSNLCNIYDPAHSTDTFRCRCFDKIYLNFASFSYHEQIKSNNFPDCCYFPWLCVMWSYCHIRSVAGHVSRETLGFIPIVTMQSMCAHAPQIVCIGWNIILSYYHDYAKLFKSIGHPSIGLRWILSSPLPCVQYKRLCLISWTFSLLPWWLGEILYFIFHHYQI